MQYTLPEAVEVGGAEYPVRWEYRPILDICAALSDPELSEQERALTALDIFYPDFLQIPEEHLQEALDRCMWFIACGRQDGGQKGAKLVDWEQDFYLIAPPVNHVLGREIRGSAPLHWWSFIGAYQEIGDCTFAQVVRIREKKAKNKPLDKQDREFYRRNRDLVEIRRTYTETENDILKEWSGSAACLNRGEKT